MVKTAGMKAANHRAIIFPVDGHAPATRGNDALNLYREDLPARIRALESEARAA